MDVVIERFGTLDFSQFAFPLDLGGRRQTPQVLPSDIENYPPRRPLQWIKETSDFARSGRLQAAALLLSLFVLALTLLLRRRQRPIVSQNPASAVKWPYEALSQLSRASAVAFLIRAYLANRSHLPVLALAAYIFGLGLIRPGCTLQWRRRILRHVNPMLLVTVLLLVLAEFLPCVQARIQCATDQGIKGALTSLGAAIVVAAATPAEWLPPQIPYDIPDFDPLTRGPGLEETVSWFNYFCSYEWLTPIVWKGTRGRLEASAIPKLAWYDEPLYLLRKIQEARALAKSTMWTSIRFQRAELALMAFWIASAFVVENVAPFGMFKLLEYLDSPTIATYRPWVWLAMVFLGPLTRSLLFQQYVFTGTRLIVRIKSAMTQELYHKALESMELEQDPFQSAKRAGNAKENPAKIQKSTSAGRLANLMAADVDAIFRARDVMMIAVGVPAGTAISLIGLYRMLGWTSLVGTAVLILATPISFWLSRIMYKTQIGVRKTQDARISLVTEYLASIRAIKFFAWEDAITSKIIAARAREQNGLWRIAVLQTVISQVTQAFPFFSLLVMFGLYVGVGDRRLDASTAFTTVLLVKNIRRNIMMASALSRQVAGAFVAFGRLDKFFATAVPLVQYPVGPLRIINASFRRNKKAVFSLENIALNFVEGGLNVVTGQSGSGKSTLLMAILGETYLEAGAVTAPSDIAYASQTAWLQNDTIQGNILFGSPMDRTRYNRVIDACCLLFDLRELPLKDQTVVGENGTSLSGGQKARVALARALYSGASLILLDDIFSALDAKTSAGVWKRAFCSNLLKGRTTVLVTQIPWIASQADYAISLERGRVVTAEAHIGAVRRPITIAEALGGDDDDDESGTETPIEDELAGDGEAQHGTNKPAGVSASRDLVNQEMKASGKVGRLTFLEYMGYFGRPIFGISCIVGLFLSNIFSFGGTFWLSIWVEAYNKKGYVDIAFYMGIYAAFTFLELLSFGFIIVMFEWGAWRAARKLHNDFIRAIMGVPLSWFKTIPVGRITNRFSGDMASIDGMISSLLRSGLDAIMMLFFRIAAISSIMPVFMIPALFTCLFGVVIGEMYTRTAVVLKRLASSAQSPVFSQFADTLAGLAVIRAREGKSKEFGKELAAKLRIWSAASETNYNCNRWVAVRVDFVTSLVALCAGIIAISQAGLVGAGLVGFSLTNANGLNQTILMLVRAMNDLEVEIQSFHRVKEYVKLEPEDAHDSPYPDEGEYADDDTHVIPKNWPRGGDIEFRNVTIRYDPDGPDILTDVNLKFKAGERVAVVGRTGSGKSTLVLSLLRFTHIVSGQILYDGVDISNVPRDRLRKSLTIIPQEAVLFNGTVASNLDPTGLIPHERLEKALENCRGIASFSGSDYSSDTEEGEDDDDDDDDDDGGGSNNNNRRSQGISLSTEVDAQGENFSHGQRQVLSLCRALIRESKLMLLDEATASMDYETDRGIQKVLRDELERVSGGGGGGRTLVTIAHRLRTIIDYDGVVVMSAGKVVECGSPKDLFESKGLFYDMIYHSGEMEELKAILNIDDDKDAASTQSSSATTQVEQTE